MRAVDAIKSNCPCTVCEIGYSVEICTHVALFGNDIVKLGLDTKGQPLTRYDTIIQPFPTLTQHHESCSCCHQYAAAISCDQEGWI
ncbi:hypothetical protein Nepgr_019443 [Nepenthes gracilis]|uniref:Uncharacterized protein n=1 Tax=Nepenthes gracilis TaxID=150966 RepID=A0AAD3SV11_NEPGR|nr:hypothetical protein Nepgr_019443 [Nepenthes gracilis]